MTLSCSATDFENDRLKKPKQSVKQRKLARRKRLVKLKEFYASREPYGEWIDRNLVELAKLRIPNVKVEGYTGDQLTRLQKVFGYKYEDVNTLLF